MNLVILNGRLTDKPELKISVNGKEYCQFTLAVRRYYKKDSENSTDFVDCIAYGNLARYIAHNSYFDKGKPMLVKEGMIYTKSQNILGKQINLMQVVVLSVEYNLSDINNAEKSAQNPGLEELTGQEESDNVSKTENKLNKPVKSRRRVPRSKPLYNPDEI